MKIVLAIIGVSVAYMAALLLTEATQLQAAAFYVLGVFAAVIMRKAHA